MTTTLDKPVTRRTNEVRPDRGRRRAVIVTRYPTGHVGLRSQGTRREEAIPIALNTLRNGRSARREGCAHDVSEG
jgi:hypothetical protein